MNNVHIEHRILEQKKVNVDLINHLRDYCTLGPAAIITDNPATFLSTFRKQWIREMTFLAKARASTLDADKIAQLSRELLIMETLQFDARGWGGNSADVYILSPQQLDLIPAACATLCLYTQSKIDLDNLTHLLDPGQDITVIDYSKSLSATPRKTES